jgi:hypothetical protein
MFAYTLLVGHHKVKIGKAPKSATFEYHIGPQNFGFLSTLSWNRNAQTVQENL